LSQYTWRRTDALRIQSAAEAHARFTAFGIVDADVPVPALTLGQWYHMVAVRNPTTVQMYLNGNPVGNLTASVAIVLN
jgi:hypothetical protein